ncbi:MAG: M1 family metallopeptidase [Ignavibacteriales bacterium]|nr:M1 family metallopeptidase [Ignavibacteriales bacterium]MCF8315774.1 M1 family metallopeptidase [Ignavibacteriales bacterium]MCF8437234.1 M1 family metallopeptidase [Ignavibacteriales bacterium]
MKVKKNHIYLIFIFFLIVLFAGFILILNVNLEKAALFSSSFRKIASPFIFSKDEISWNGTKTSDKIDIKVYDISLRIFPQKRTIDAEVILKGTTLAKIESEIFLNFYDNLEIEYLKLNGSPSEFEQNNDKISIPFRGNAGTDFEILVKYSGKPSSRGLGSFEIVEKEGNFILYTINEPVYASTWFPCNDIPADKALLKIAITNDSSSVSISNGRLTDVSNNGDTKTYFWESVYPIATYLIAVYSGPYSSFSDQYVSMTGDTLDLQYYSLPGNLENAKKDFAFHPKALNVFEKLFGPYPFIKEKYAVAEFLWNHGAMENQTITGIGTELVGGLGLFESMLVHELSHHWFGNSVSPANWKEIWLNEGFATYCEALYYEYVGGREALFSSLPLESPDYDDVTLYNPGRSLFVNTVYSKGAYVLHMLRREMGDEKFFSLLREYYKKYSYSNATTENFKELASNISGKNLDSFFDQWVISGKGKIELKYSFNRSSGNELYIQLDQCQKGYPVYNFLLDLSLTSTNGIVTDTTLRISNKSFRFFIPGGEKPEKIDFDKENWLLASVTKK